MAPADVTNEEGFFEKVRTNKLDLKTRTAIEQLRALGEEASFAIVFNENPNDDSMLLFVTSVSPTASVLKVESSGRLMLMTDHHGGRRKVQNALDGLAHKLEWKRLQEGETTSDKKPTFDAGMWEDGVDAILSALNALAREEEPVVAAPPVRRQRPAPVTLFAPAAAVAHPLDAIALDPASPTALDTTPVANRSLRESRSLPVSPTPSTAGPDATAAADEPTADPAELEVRVAALLRTGVQTAPPSGSDEPRRVGLSNVFGYERLASVKAWVLDAAHGICEACGATAPFVTAAGEPFLEVHHVTPLAQGGRDRVTNAVALCPNCHRALHLSVDAMERRRALQTRVPRLFSARAPAGPSS